MMLAVRRRLSRLYRDQRGAAAVEFAMIAPAFFALLLGIVDVGRYMWTLNTMQYAIDDAIRAGVVQEMTPEDVEARVKETLAHISAVGLAVEALPTSSTLEVTAQATYAFLFPISSFMATTTISLRSEMPK
ncbi:MAG TPA: TadE/TadG family type IV pilus assembly protein [Dongiaceae bacterium]|nr:TadE/TadG family type IV pilus assembly protein [Dongiaceae bacterium]